MNTRKLSKTAPVKFDPFSDRRARDIRNQLSESFVYSIACMDSNHFEQIAHGIIGNNSGGIYNEYAYHRLELYRNAFNQIQNDKFSDPRQQVTVLWNLGLFFEVHELLEELWQPAKGELKRALKGLIQAAGVYVHFQQGNQKAAKGLAKRALIHLEQAGSRLTFINEVSTLIHKLRHLDDVPPYLKKG